MRAKKDILFESTSLPRCDQGKRRVATLRLHHREVENGSRRGALLQPPHRTSIKSLMNGVSPRAVNPQPEGIVRHFHLLSPPDDLILCSGRFNPGLLSSHGFLTESVLQHHSLLFHPLAAASTLGIMGGIPPFCSTLVNWAEAKQVKLENVGLCPGERG